MQDIADALAVSRATVDRVLNGRGRVSRETTDRILGKAQELGYVPNLIARRLALHRSLKFGVVRPREPRRFFDLIGQGLERAGRELTGYGVGLIDFSHDHHDPAAQRETLGRVIDTELDGVVLVPSHKSDLDSLINHAVDLGISVVTLNTDAPESLRHFHVGHDFYRSGRMAGELMARFLEDRESRRGTKMMRVAQLTGLWDATSRVERLDGFRASIAEFSRNIELSGPHIFSDTIEDAQTIAARLLDGPDPPDGFFSTSGDGHVAVARELIKRGLSATVRNIGFDVDSHVTALMKRNAIHATIDQAPYFQGYHAIRLLHEHLATQPIGEGTKFYTRAEILLRTNIEASEHTVNTAHHWLDVGASDRGNHRLVQEEL